MIFGKQPFPQGVNPTSHVEGLLEALQDDKPLVGRTDLETLLRGLLETAPELRMTTDQALGSDWLASKHLSPVKKISRAPTKRSMDKPVKLLSVQSVSSDSLSQLSANSLPGLDRRSES